jgi:hypothetical protein
VASTLRESTTSPASSSTLSQWQVLPTSKPTQNVISLPRLLSCIEPPLAVVLAPHGIPLARLTLQSDPPFSQIPISGLRGIPLERAGGPYTSSRLLCGSENCAIPGSPGRHQSVASQRS